MNLSQSTLVSLEDQKSLCIAHIEAISLKLLDAEERLAHLDAEIRKIRDVRVEKPCCKMCVSPNIDCSDCAWAMQWGGASLSTRDCSRGSERPAQQSSIFDILGTDCVSKRMDAGNERVAA